MSSLKSVGVFWDIENCCVPKDKSALKIIERIRERFFQDCREAEFICVCDINKELDVTIKELNDGQINVVHINACAKNAADDKIRQSLRRFSDSHPPGTKVILISSDVNFASDLSDLRHRKKFEVVLIHKAQVSDALLACATEDYLYEDLIRDLPDRPGVKPNPQDVKDHILVVYGYTKDMPQEKIRQVLKMLSNNCGGKVISIGPQFAILKLDTPELLERAKKRMNGQDVYGRKITVCLPEESPFYHTIRKLNAIHQARRQESPSPQRRPGRERKTSRSFTPDLYDNSAGAGFMGHSSSPSYNHDVFMSAGSPWNGKSFRAPGAANQPGYMSSPGMDKQGNSPSHTHTLPNSNSERYYSTKSGTSHEKTPSFFSAGSRPTIAAGLSGMPSGNGPSNHGNTGAATYVMGDLSRAANSSGEPITVFKPGGDMKLSDIPIPSFGFRDIPPPTMLPAATDNSRLDPSTVAFDPIKLMEAACQDTRAFITSKSAVLGPNFHPEHPESQPAVQPASQMPYGGGKFFDPFPTTNRTDGGGFASSQSSAFTKHQPSPPAAGYQVTPQQQQHQPRCLSVPAQQTNMTMEEKPSFESDVYLSNGVSQPSGTFRSQSQNSGAFKKPASIMGPFKNMQNSAGYQRYPSPSGRSDHSRSASREHRKSFSSDGEERPYSPVNSSRQNFRPSATSPGILSASPTHRGPLPQAAAVRPKQKQHGSNLYRVPTPDEIGDPSMDYQHPEFNSQADPYVEIVVSNLDYNIHPREWRKIIYATFLPHVKILSIQVRLQADHTSLATVRLTSEQDARFAISQFHRRKIGYKKINVQLKTECSQSPSDSLKTDTIALLMEARDNKMALSRLIDLFDKRFHKTVSVSDVYKMRDIIQITEIGGTGRWVKLQPGIRRSPTPVHVMEDEASGLQELPVCYIHCPEGSEVYTEALNCYMLPNVMIVRKHFSPQLHSLLLSHNGYIPVMSFPACFAAEFEPIQPVVDGGGIPLEHVISCVPGVEITVTKTGVKVIQFQENREQFYDMMKGNSWQELGKISREVMELLRQEPACTMPISKFIPAYHHYFGRQCRVADYGYTKLQKLFEAIPHAIQILGTGDRKAITLSHRAQIKRFTTDIVKVVKMQPTKQLMLDDFPPAYEKVMNKPLYLPHYGVCYLEDVLLDIPATTLLIIEEGSHTLLALPRREQTPEEVERMKLFAMEVVDLLKHNPQCSMPFNKFIPAYHHHFGRQCRVSDYGFTKLTDLFEAIGHIIEMEDDDEERMIHLTAAESRNVLCEQLISLIRPVETLPVSEISAEYSKQFGFSLKPEDFGANSVKGLLLSLKNHIKMELRNGQEYVSLVKGFTIPQLGLQIMQILMDESGGSLPLMELCMRFESKFGYWCDVAQIKWELTDFVQIDESEFDSGCGIIRLTSHQMLGRNLRLLLLHRPCIAMNDLYTIYREQYGVELKPALYGFSTLHQLLLSFPHILELKGKSPQKYIQASHVMAEPETLPPSRVDVTSPLQFGFSASNNLPEPDISSTSHVSSELSLPPTSDLLRHASQLWDPSIAMQSVTTAAESSDLLDHRENASFPMMNDLSVLEKNMGTLTMNGEVADSHRPCVVLSERGVPVAWHMKVGGEKVLSGNVGAMAGSPDVGHSPSHKPKKKTHRSKKSRSRSRAQSKNSGGNHSDHEHNQSGSPSPQHNRNFGCSGVLTTRYNSQNQDASTPVDLNTGSTQSRQSSSSPGKRKPRIAASFKPTQE